MTYLPPNTLSNFLPTDVSFPEDDEAFLEKLEEVYKSVAFNVNEREIALYLNAELMTGQQYFTADPQRFRGTFRKVVNFGALPNAGAKSVAHGLAPDASFSITRLYAAATDPVGFNYIPIPYASLVLINNVELSMDVTNVTITTGIDRTAFTICYVVIEYLRN